MTFLGHWKTGQDFLAPATSPSSSHSENRPSPNGDAETHPRSKTTLQQSQAALHSRWSWKMRQRILSSAPTTRDAPTRSLRGAAPASGTGKGNPCGRLGPPPPGHRADAEEKSRRPPAKLGAPRTGWRGSRQTSGLACQTPVGSPQTPQRQTTVSGMNTLMCSCLRKILHHSQAFF